MNRITLVLTAALALGACTDRHPTASSPEPTTAPAPSAGVGEHGGGIPWSVAFASTRSGNADIFAMHAQGTDQPSRAPARNLTAGNGGADQFPAWSADGRIAFASARPSAAAAPHTNLEIYVMEGDGSAPTRLTTSTAANIQPAWSPDGSEIAFVRGNLGSRQIWVLSLRDGSERKLTSAGDNYRPNWSPDGRAIVFGSDRDGDFVNALPRERTNPTFGLHDIYVMDPADGAILARLTENRTSVDGEPTYSPNGREIAFRTRRFTDANGDNYCAVVVMDADGTNLRNLTPIPDGVTFTQWCNAFPAWSRDGREVYFHSNRPTELGLQTEIYAVRADGTNLRRLTFSAGNDVQPAVR